MTAPHPAIVLRQSSLFGSCPITDAVAALANAGIDERGAIFTKREVVDFLLDLTGYTSDRPLHTLRLMEPSFGGGDFLLAAVDRLLAAWRTADTPMSLAVQDLSGAIRAVELHRASFDATRSKCIEALRHAGLSPQASNDLADAWLIHGDYLLADIEAPFDVVIGNPPYVRQELIPDVLLAEYRNRYETVYDRADLYIPFIERSLMSLKQGGQLGFICADRWMKNRYGGPLRRLVSASYHLKIFVDMVNTQPFHSEVSAYPAITVIAREGPGVTRIARQPSLDAFSLRTLADALLAHDVSQRGSKAVRTLASVASGSEPWILDTSDLLSIIRRIETDFPSLEDASCKVGIGVATGRR